MELLVKLTLLVELLAFDSINFLMSETDVKLLRDGQFLTNECGLLRLVVLLLENEEAIRRTKPLTGNSWLSKSFICGIVLFDLAHSVGRRIAI